MDKKNMKIKYRIGSSVDNDKKIKKFDYQVDKYKYFFIGEKECVVLSSSEILIESEAIALRYT